MDYWVFAVHGLGRRGSAGAPRSGRPGRRIRPVRRLRLFHEFGHAAGCRYGGARSGRIGVGIYLVWPSFFTNVTDSYRLSRGRAAAHRPRRPVLQPDLHPGPGRSVRGHRVRDPAPRHRRHHLEMLEQLLPFVRFDGYFILSRSHRCSRLVRPRRAHLDKRPAQGSARTRGSPECGANARMIVTAWVLLRHPAACIHPGVHAVASPRDGPRAVAFLSLQAHPWRRRPLAASTRQPPPISISILLAALPVAGSVLHRCRACRRAARGPALVHRIPAPGAFWSPSPLWPG